MNSSLLRAEARESLAGKWPLAMGVAALAVLLGGLGTYFLPEFSYDFSIPLDGEWELFDGFRLSFKNGVFGLAAFILGGVLELGYSRFVLKLHDKENVEFSDLFSQFDRFGAGFAQHFLRDLYSLLWGLLFIIPGIIKSFSYAMTPYIMIDHPELSANDAITASKEMMDGHKWELFILHLTFIGWAILAGLCLNLGHLALNPYRKTAEAAFYRELANQPRITVE